MANPKKEKDTASISIEAVLQEKVDVFFTEYPKSKEVHATTDHFLFTNLKFARDHAKTLGTEVTTLKNANLIEVEIEEEETEETEE